MITDSCFNIRNFKQLGVALLIVGNIFAPHNCGAAADLEQLAGNIEDPSGRPIKNALVVLYSAEDFQQTTSGPDGNFSFNHVSLSKHELQSFVNGFERTIISLTNNSAAEPVSIVPRFSSCPSALQLLPKVLKTSGATDKGTVSGIVQSYDGQPLPGVSIAAFTESVSHPSQSVLTDAYGRFMFSSLFPGKYILFGFKTSYQSFAEFSIWNVVGHDSFVSFRMSRMGPDNMPPLCE